MKKILVTGFEPFGGDETNVSEQVLNSLPEIIGNLKVEKLLIPVVRNKSLRKIEEKVLEINPSFILSLGQAGGSKTISIERIGINIDDFRIKDNDGNQPIDELIFEDGENAYFSNLPIKTMYNEIEKEGIDVKISNTAGTYVCNHVLYGVRYMVEKNKWNIKSGFIHLPYTKEQVEGKENMPFMMFDQTLKAIIKAIETLSVEKVEKKIVGGEIY
ncbi:pyroglutamyl-peptidase I [Streptobacillus felis]|uniref:Pyroglutamyl-peptidase I n=1 Tax=Streptobacillus felis TaxID=1384509 RepID=A0A7Z0PFX7_9FUSO|nr:pyroglutamyl-peptidase I [Streptobacillus felis]NYV27510.1 pyroglutamyl-peptidase I [Streptobacillus felis]